MKSSNPLLQNLLLVLPAVYAAPYPQYAALREPRRITPNMASRIVGNYGENTGAVGGETPPIPTVTVTSGALRGDSSLLGGNFPEPTPTDSAIVNNPILVNGQEADTDLGLYLDFDSADPPQPERGGFGNTDPGPRRIPKPQI